jgi:transcriptional regulator with XRE-family HTH domain
MAARMATVEAHELSVGKRIRWARRRKGLSQDKLAERVGTTRQVVIRWEKDRHLPNERSRERLAQATGQEADFFAERRASTNEDDDEEAEVVADLLASLRRVLDYEFERRAALSEGGQGSEDARPSTGQENPVALNPPSESADEVPA